MHVCVWRESIYIYILSIFLEYFLIIIALIIDDCLYAKPAAWYFICIIAFLAFEHIKQVTYLHLQVMILKQKT